MTCFSVPFSQKDQAKLCIAHWPLVENCELPQSKMSPDAYLARFTLLPDEAEKLHTDAPILA